MTGIKIGIFDSGLGGLTVVRSIREHLPDVDIVYIADTANAPYGEKSHSQIRDLSDRIAKYLIKTHKVDALVIACNTATSAAVSYLREKHPETPIVGTEPGIKPAMTITKSHKVGILATPATLSGDKYQELADKLYNGTDITLYEQACPGLVEKIESGQIYDQETKSMLERWLKPMREAGVDTIVLGCTHYPIVSELISDIMNNSIELIETGGAIAARLKNLLNYIPSERQGSLELYSTGEIDRQAVNRILKQDIDEILHIDI